MQIKAIDPINRPFFAGEVSGIDWRKVPTHQRVRWRFMMGAPQCKGAPDMPCLA